MFAFAKRANAITGAEKGSEKEGHGGSPSTNVRGREERGKPIRIFRAAK